MSVTVFKLCSRCAHGAGVTLIGVYQQIGAEILALAALRRTDFKPVSPELVQRMFGELAGHRHGCSCWRCHASKVGAGRVWQCLQAWQRATTAAPMVDIDPRPRKPRRRWSRDPT